ncbi:MAG: secretin N-terminal domain-containing protein, partial [Aureliella sp.]
MRTKQLRFSIVLGTASLVAASTPLAVLRADEPAAAAPAPAVPAAGVPAAAQPASQPAAQAETAPAAEPSSAVASHRVNLNFRDEEWLPALEWLAEELKLNLDWQTLPEGKLSLFSTKDYEIEEAEDLMNMQLLARGFTLLKRGEVLRLVPLKDIDITLVPHVTPDELDGLGKHQVVRVSIPLEWMVAENAAAEFKPLLSPYGQMFPMASSNRLEVLDAVVNLRELVRLLREAESDDGRRIRVVEFRLEHRKAAEVAIQVRELLGLPADGSPGRSTQTQLDIEQAKFKAEAVKQLGSNARDLIADKKKPDTFLVVNEKDNSIVVNAPPDKLEMVRQTIETLDKPLPPSESSWQTLSRVKVHPVNGFDPETISKLLLSLQERGNLAKDTRIQHEKAYNRIIAFASPEDHLTIAQLIESYRAEKRSASVIPLSSIQPQYAVRAIQLILKNPDRPSNAPGVESDGEFQIEADPDNNRLLVWATSEELSEVREFLISLGETFEQTETNSQMHVLNVGSSDVAEVTRRLQKIWNEVSDAPLVIERKPGVSSSGRTDQSSAAPQLPPARASRAAVEPGAGKPSAGQASDGQPADGLPAKGDNVRLVSAKETDRGAEGAIAERNARADAAAAADGRSPGDAAGEASAQARGDSLSGAGQPPVRIIEGKKGDVV